MTIIEQMRIKHLYEIDGLSSHKIARIVNRAPGYISAVIKRSGARVRTRSEAMQLNYKKFGCPCDNHLPRVSALADAGTSILMIAKLTGLEKKTVRRLLNKKKEEKQNECT